ncbi:MIP/aquaporin family protein [Zavarzinella formosa]|uniref:MIP/aquaporin family protein n=1 Tax=Zavarzinella formosa TaxID=360055 RepID=UPI0002EB2143|nr:aquaporin [Zavarzinella formosa]
MTSPMVRPLLAELFGTFALVFAGTGAIVVNDTHGGAITHVGIAITFGLIVLAMIYTIGDVSGCHLNPAVSVGLWLSGRFPGRGVLPYAVCQMAGALLASGLLRGMFPDHPTLGTTRPAGGDAGNGFVMETVLTFILMTAILGSTTGNRYKTPLAGLVIGSVIVLEAMVGGPVSGASMNPARSFGPAAVSLRWDFLWIYLTAPFAGSLAGVVFWKIIGASQSLPTENHA